MADLFWDVHDPQALRPAGEGSPTNEVQLRRLVLELEGRIDRLSMICCAMWTVIQAHAGVDDAELARLVEELDLADGQLDGKAAEPQVAPCTACQRPVAVRHRRCLYCGEPRRASHPFQGVM